MKALLLLCFFVLSCLFSFMAFAQLPTQANFHVLRYNVDNGLPTNNINAITQDQQGFIWLATDDGLVRFDGKNFITFRHSEPTNQLPESKLVGVFADSQNCLWIGTQSKGIVCYNLKTREWKVFPDYKVRTDFHIVRFAEDKDHNIWIDIIYNNPKEQKNNPTMGFQYVLRVAPISYATKLFAIDSIAFDKQKQADTVFLRAAPQAGMVWADKQGNIYKGIYAYDSKTETFERSSLQQANLDTLKSFNGVTNQNELTKMAPNNVSFTQVAQTIDQQGRVWWARDVINIFDPKQKTVQQLLRGHTNGATLKSTVFGLAYHQALDVMWVGLYRRGLMGMDCKTGRLALYANIPHIEKSLPNNHIISDLFVDKQQGLWIAMEGGGLAYYHPKAQKFGHYYQQQDKVNWLTNNVVQSFTSNNSEEIWVGTKEGLHRWLPKMDSFQVFIRQSNYLKNSNPKMPSNPKDAINDIKSLLADSTQLWIGTWGFGLHTTNLPLTTSPPIFEKYLLYRTEQKRKEKQDFMNLVDWLSGLAIDKKNRLWLANGSADLWAFDKKRKQFIDTLPTQDKVYSVVTLYGSCETCKGYKILRDGRFATVATDGVQWTWAGTLNGLYRVNLQTKEMKGYFGNDEEVDAKIPENTPQKYLPNSYVSTVFFEPKNRQLWIGTPSGLAVMDRNTETFRVFGAMSGFKNVNIKGILADDKGNLWVSTNGGLAVFNIATHKVIKTYTAKDGLQSNSFLPNSALRIGTGEMLFGGENGFNFFHPDSVLKNYNDFVPPVVLTKLSIEGKDYNVDSVRYAANQEIWTSYDQSNIDLSVAALNFVNPEDNRYQYRLRTIRSWLGLAFTDFLGIPFADTTKGKWYEARNGNIELPNQQHGYYLLEVRATNNEGELKYELNEEFNGKLQLNKDNPLVIAITVTPPFYAVWKFWLAVIIIIGLSTYALFRYRIASLEKQKADLKQKVAEKTAELNSRNIELNSKNSELEAQKEEIKLQAEQLAMANDELAATKKLVENKYSSHIHDHQNYFQQLHILLQKANPNSHATELYELVQQIDLYIFSIMEIDQILYAQGENKENSEQNAYKISNKTPLYLINRLVDFCKKTTVYDSRVQILTEIDAESEQITLNATEKTAFGVIILELLRNSLKYAFQDFDCENPSINIHLVFKESYKENYKTKNVYELQVKDNGKGLSNIKEYRTGSKGLQLVEEFAKSLEAYLKIESEIGKGTSYVFQIKR